MKTGIDEHPQKCWKETAEAVQMKLDQLLCGVLIFITAAALSFTFFSPKFVSCTEQNHHVWELISDTFCKL